MPQQEDERDRQDYSHSRLLNQIATDERQRRIFRLSVLINDEDFFEELGLSREHELDLKQSLAESNHEESLESLLDAPFRPKHRLLRKTRFSDGSYPVFYGALELETAEVESSHWYKAGFCGSPSSPRTAYYQRLSCSFRGKEKDLRKVKDEWPQLVDDDYTFCNAIGSEARQSRLDGLVAPSARHRSGSTTPVFSRQSISQGQDEGVVKMTLVPGNEEVEIAET